MTAVRKIDAAQMIREELVRHTVYMAALGGGGALSALRVEAQEVIAFADLGTEAVRTMELNDFPVWVVNDCAGRDFYQETMRPWRKNGLLPEDLRIPAEISEGDGGG